MNKTITDNVKMLTISEFASFVFEQCHLDEFKALDSMELGPVYTGEKRFPLCLRLQNFYEFSKVFPCDLEEDGSCGQKYWNSKHIGYNDPIARPYKYKKGMIPLHSTLYDGNLGINYGPITQRDFLSEHYEYLARLRPEYNLFLKYIQKSNIDLKGYQMDDNDDVIWKDPNADSIEDWLDEKFNDPLYAYHYEFILLTMVFLDMGYIAKRPWYTFKVDELYPPTTLLKSNYSE